MKSVLFFKMLLGSKNKPTGTGGGVEFHLCLWIHKHSFKIQTSQVMKVLTPSGYDTGYIPTYEGYCPDLLY